jgi:hypothetical protein
MSLPLVTALTGLCGGTRNSLHGTFFSVTVHATVGMYLPINNMLTVYCGGARDALQSIFFSAAIHAIVGTISRPVTLHTPHVAHNILRAPHTRHTTLR